MLITIILSIVIIILIFVIINLNKKTSSLKKEISAYDEIAISSEKNDLLSKILSLSFENESLPIQTKKICDVLIDYYNIDYCTIFTTDSRNKLNVCATNVSNGYINDIEVYANDIIRTIDDSKLGRIIYSDYFLDYPSASNRHIRYFQLLPLISRNKLIGALMIENRKVSILDGNEVDFFKIVVENITILLQNFIFSDKLMKSAMVDGLTGVNNRNCMEIELKEAFKLHQNNRSNFSMAIFDIDHFKKFNDTYGHAFGDIVLKRVAQFVNSNIRPDDSIYRYGGEEFVVYFPKTAGKDIYYRVDEIREMLSNLEVTDESGTKTSVTASFGIAEYAIHGNSIDEIIKNADKALYHSKESGRNKVTLYYDDL
ncbi:GGDEF domain-containing protein [Wukongibacter baidiensis]